LKVGGELPFSRAGSKDNKKTDHGKAVHGAGK